MIGCPVRDHGFGVEWSRVQAPAPTNGFPQPIVKPTGRPGSSQPGSMFEAQMAQAALLKQIIESIRELITEATFEVSGTGMMLQAMDSSHVSLVALNLRSDGFQLFRADRPFSMGMNLNHMAKMLKCAGKDDTLTMRADEASDLVTFLFESPGNERLAEFELKLMDITSENLGIPDAEYSATVSMPSAEFQRIVKDLGSIGDTVEITVTKDDVRFAASGDIGNATIKCRQLLDTEKPEDRTLIEMVEPVNLTFALRYLINFSKATSLSPSVTIKLSTEMPVVVEYKLSDIGYVRFYLAPKIEDEEMEGEA